MINRIFTTDSLRCDDESITNRHSGTDRNPGILECNPPGRVLVPFSTVHKPGELGPCLRWDDVLITNRHSSADRNPDHLGIQSTLRVLIPFPTVYKLDELGPCLRWDDDNHKPSFQRGPESRSSWNAIHLESPHPLSHSAQTGRTGSQPSLARRINHKPSFRRRPESSQSWNAIPLAGS